MNHSKPQSASRRPLPLELMLVVGLPLAAIIASSTSAYLAYVKGFTAIPEHPAAVHVRR